MRVFMVHWLPQEILPWYMFNYIGGSFDINSKILTLILD